MFFFFFSSRRRHTRLQGDWSSDVCSSDLKVYANDAGDAGRYRLATSFKQGDTCKNGGPACSLEGAEELKLPSDSKTADVDYSRSKQFHFYRATFKERGKLTITFKVLQPQRGSKGAAYFMKNPDDEGDRISGTSVTKEIDQPGEFYIRVQAPESGDYAKYAMATIFQPSNFIPADVVEIGRSPCLLTVSAGTNQGVRAGFGCTVVNASGQAIDSCVVDQTFPNLSKVKPASRSEEHTSELQSPCNLVCRLLLEKKKQRTTPATAFSRRLSASKLLNPAFSPSAPSRGTGPSCSTWGGDGSVCKCTSTRQEIEGL